MDNVEFPEEEKIENTNGYEEPKVPMMVALVMKTGLIKNEKQANFVLVGVAVVFLVLAVSIIFGMRPVKKTPTYIEDIPAEIRETLPPEILDSLPSRYE
jgi:type IV secretory pathway component VirB8